MGEFFRGWRRKMGVTTLLMALMLMAGWVRSTLRKDSIYVRISSYDVVIFNLQDQSLIIGEIGNTVWAGSYPWLQPRLSLGQEHNSINSLFKPNDMSPEECFFTQWRRFGFGFSDSYSGVWTVTHYIVPYYSLVFPLTVISAYLLLINPRKSNRKKLAEPVTVEGT